MVEVEMRSNADTRRSTKTHVILTAHEVSVDPDL
jgi:hypothetical protein